MNTLIIAWFFNIKMGFQMIKPYKIGHLYIIIIYNFYKKYIHYLLQFIFTIIWINFSTQFIMAENYVGWTEQFFDETLWEVKDRYINLSQLGRGAYGSVWLVIYRFF